MTGGPPGGHRCQGYQSARREPPGMGCGVLKAVGWARPGTEAPSQHVDTPSRPPAGQPSIEGRAALDGSTANQQLRHLVPRTAPPPNLLGSGHHDDSGHPPHCQLWAHSRDTGVSHLLSEPEERIPRPELPLTPLPPRRTGPAQDPERGGRKDGDQVSGHH